HGDKIGADVKETIEAKKKALEEAKAGEDAAAIETAIAELMTASQEVAKKVYEEVAKTQATEAGAATPPPESAGEAAETKEEKVIDADFEVK
ncbi:MAG: molecular chaperone DnaK, partial [Planctomycetota bacterium]